MTDLAPEFWQMFAGAVHGFASTVLLVGGTSKLGRDFGSVVVSYRLLPEELSRATGAILPATEVAFAILLALWGSPAVALPASLLFMVFAIAIAINMVRGRTYLDCGCNMRRAAPIHWSMMAANLLVGLLLATTMVWQRDAFSLSASTGLALGIGGNLLMRLKTEIHEIRLVALTTGKSGR